STLDARQLQRFKNEAQAAAHLHHQSIVPVYATGCERGVHYYAMQFIEGQTLAAIIAEFRTQRARECPGARRAPEALYEAANAALTGLWLPNEGRLLLVPTAGQPQLAATHRRLHQLHRRPARRLDLRRSTRRATRLTSAPSPSSACKRPRRWSTHTSL